MGSDWLAVRQADQKPGRQVSTRASPANEFLIVEQGQATASPSGCLAEPATVQQATQSYPSYPHRPDRSRSPNSVMPPL
jgi:hypothetical protein